MGSEVLDMTTFWIDAAGRLIKATSDPDTTPSSAVDSTEVGPDSPRYQTWDGVAWVDDASRAVDEQREQDTAALRGAGKDAILVLTELVSWLVTNTAMQATDFTPQVKQAYLNLKTIADRVKT